jgi:hypothetical protein
MDRAFKLWIAPSLLGLVVAAVLGLLLAALWQAAAVGTDSLDRQIYERAMVDRGYHDRIMAEVDGATDTLLLAVAAVVWMTAVAWFAACWRTPVAEVGAVRRLRSRWRLTCLGGLVVGLLVAGYVAFWGSQLSALIMLGPLVLLFLFLVPFFGAIYYAAGVLCTHRVYLPAIPWSRWRTWQI